MVSNIERQVASKGPLFADCQHISVPIFIVVFSEAKEQPQLLSHNQFLATLSRQATFLKPLRLTAIYHNYEHREDIPEDSPDKVDAEMINRYESDASNFESSDNCRSFTSRTDRQRREQRQGRPGIDLLFLVDATECSGGWFRFESTYLYTCR